MRRPRALAFGLALGLCFASPAGAGTAPPLVGLGDSLGEGVQSADANRLTQPTGYLNLIATQMGLPFPLPLIRTRPTGVVGETRNRSRIDPSLEAANLAVSGADSTSILTDAADGQVDSEADLVLAPRTGTQISIAQSLGSPFMLAWIGSTDAMSAVLAFDHLDASQLTPVPTFQANMHEIVQSLTAGGARVAFANIPDVAQIGYLFSNRDLRRFLGNDHGLPDGSYTSLPAMLLIKLGIKDDSILQDPDWVLDATEVQTIRNTVDAYNQIIAAEAAQAGMPVVDIDGLFRASAATPPVIGGVTLTLSYLGGLFSLDGVHPSNIGHALIANAFIATINAAFGMSVPPIDPSALEGIMRADPFVDKDGDLHVKGRPFNGLLETLGPFLGITGSGGEPGAAAGVDRTLGPRLMRGYFAATGRDPATAWTQDDAIAALRHALGVDSLLGRARR
jgi:phospholipase/lecithinase/hemolysin